VERRAAEPVLPLHLFANRVFSSASSAGLVIGFAMFGALAYLPQYMQVVRGTSPTASGLRLLPMMAGLLLTSIGTGQLVSKWGRYKIFPVVGTAVMTVGLFLLSLMGVATSFWLVSLYLFVLGVGIGPSMQVLVLAVQNAVDYSDLGAATSGATFFRSIGGSFGTAVFGAIFANVLPGDLARALHGVALPRGSARPPGQARPYSTTCPRRSGSATSPGTPKRCTRCSCSLRPSARWPSACVPAEGSAAAGYHAGGGPRGQHRTPPPSLQRVTPHRKWSAHCSRCWAASTEPRSTGASPRQPGCR